MAIQHKDCPRCAATVGNYITRCECGHSFDGLDDTEPTQRLEAMAEEERLYEDYLAARAKQAIAEAADARAGALNDPDNYYWKTRVEQAEATRDALMAELYQQKLRNSELQADIEQAKSLSKKKVRTLNPHKTKTQERPRSALPPPAAARVPEATKIEAVPAVERPIARAPEPAAIVIAASADRPAPSRATITPVSSSPAAAAVPDQTPAPVAEVVLDTTDASTAEADDVRAYTALLEEILSASKHTATPAPAAVERSTIVAAPESLPMTSQLATAVQKAASLLSAIDRAPAPADIVGDLPSSVLRPEERLEHDSKAIRARAVAMAERLCGTPAPMPQETSSAQHSRIPTPAVVAAVNATPTESPAAQPRVTDQPPTPAAPLVVEPAVASKAAERTELKQKKKTARAELRRTQTRHPTRPLPVSDTKAEEVRLLAGGSSASPVEPYIEDHPSAIFRAIQAARAEKIVEDARAAQTPEVNHCPFCSATHSQQVERCGCGYIFERPIELPELVLSSKERIELLHDGIQIRRPKSSR